MLGLFDETPPPERGACPHCGVPVLDAFVDTGSPMRAVRCDDGPYVLDRDDEAGTAILRFVTDDGHVLFAGVRERKLRKAPKTEERYASHFYNCKHPERWA